MTRLQALWIRLRSSLWFTPTLIVLASLALAAGLVDLQGEVSDELAQEWPRLLAASAEGSREMLGAIATSRSSSSTPRRTIGCCAFRRTAALPWKERRCWR